MTTDNRTNEQLAERLRQFAESQAMDFDNPHIAMTLNEVADRLERAEQALQRVRERHQWNRVDQYDDRLGDWVEEYCQGCHEVWPCATIRALEADDA